MADHVTHFIGGRRLGRTKELILQLADALREGPVCVLAPNEPNAKELAQRIRSEYPHCEVLRRGTFVYTKTAAQARR